MAIEAELPNPLRPPEGQPTYRRFMLFLGIAVVATLAWILRGVLVPLFFAFLLAYALDPFVDRLEALKIPRPLGALAVMFGIFGLIVLVLVYAIPMFLDELREAATDLPRELELLEARIEPWA